MNTEIKRGETAMTTFEKNLHKVRRNPTKYYRWKEYSFRYRILFPLALIDYAWKCLNKFYDSKFTWNTGRAKRVLDRALPHVASWDEEKLWYNMYLGSFNFKKWAKLKDKRFCGIYVYNIREYLKDGYEIEGYTKTIVEDGHWVVFQKKEENNS
jgi:hypothetical protein